MTSINQYEDDDDEYIIMGSTDLRVYALTDAGSNPPTKDRKEVEF